MSKYKLTQKTDANGTTQDIQLDSSCVDLSNYVDKTSAQTISGVKTMTNGLKVSGRSAGGGDDEGIIVGTASNNYAGVCCGSPSGRRAVFYLKPSATSGNSVWRYNNGSTTYDIAHPEKAGTIALTSDLSGKEDTTNKVTSLSSSSTDTQYPSAKCIYDMIGDVESLLTAINSGNGV